MVAGWPIHLSAARKSFMLHQMSSGKLTSADELVRLSSGMRSAARRLVFTNGCFDVLHVGHVRYLQQARLLGDALAVALNSDESVRAIKGETRPINSQEDRAEILAALTCVDYVTIFYGERVTELVRAVRPAIYAKGGDYTVESLVQEEVAVLREIGTEIKILPLVPGKSTSKMIEQWNQ